MKVLLVLLLATIFVGCDQATTSANTAAPPKKRSAIKRPIPVHRFVQENFNPGVAFDTQTGQICRTWDWTPMGDDPKPNKYGERPQRSLGEFSPTCISVYLVSPSQVTEYEDDDK